MCTAPVTSFIKRQETIHAWPCVSPRDRQTTPLDIVVLHLGEASTNNVVKVGHKAVTGWQADVVVGGPWPER